MFPKYIVRDAVVDETFALVEIARKVLQETEVYRGMEFDTMKTANYIYGAIMKQPGWFMRIIAEEKSNVPVGGIICWVEEWICGPSKIAYDITIMLDEEHRGRCIRQITQIIEEYKTWAISKGAKCIKFGVSSGMNMDKASAFIEGLGFKRIGAMHGFILGE